MQRTIIAIATLTVLAASTAVALEIEKKDDIVQKKPPLELRINLTTPGLLDSLTIASTENSNTVFSQREDPEDAQAQSAQAGVLAAIPW